MQQSGEVHKNALRLVSWIEPGAELDSYEHESDLRRAG
jgi:hypothetical protein